MKMLPRIAPLKLKRAHKPFDHPDWVFELKHDGFRGVAYIADGQCQLISRHNHKFESFRSLSDALGKLRVKDAILDGEIICTDGDGASLFNQLVFRQGVSYFHAFDLLWLDGEDMRPRRLLERKQRLREVLMRSKNPALLYADHVDQSGSDFFRMICEKNLEGIVAKHREHRYDSSAISRRLPTFNYG
jgi:bifunctional non-homologous end joining protein LigD